MKTGNPRVRPSVLLRVLVADSGISVNDNLTALLSEFEGLSVLGCVQEPAKVLARVQSVQPEARARPLARPPGADRPVPSDNGQEKRP